MGREGRGMVVWAAGEGIWLAVGCALPVDDFVVVGGEGGCPSGMATGCSSGLREVLEVFMVGVDLHRVLGPLHINSPVLETLHHC